MAPGLLNDAFTEEQQELRFRAEQEGFTIRLDRVGGAVGFGLWLFALLRFRRVLLPHRLGLGLALASLFLLPDLACRLLGPHKYARHRLWVLVVIRLSAIFAPGFMDIGLVHGSPAAGLPRWLAVLPLALDLPRLWYMALVFRLPFLVHCAVHAADAGAQLYSLPSVCGMPFFQHPASQAYLARGVSFLALLGIPFGFQPPAEWDPHRLGGACACVLGLSAPLAVAGYVLPALVVALHERGARAAFVLRWQRGDSGWAQEEAGPHLLHDWLGAVVRLACLLPAVLTVALQVALIATHRTGVC